MVEQLIKTGFLKIGAQQEVMIIFVTKRPDHYYVTFLLYGYIAEEFIGGLPKHNIQPPAQPVDPLVYTRRLSQLYAMPGYCDLKLDAGASDDPQVQMNEGATEGWRAELKVDRSVHLVVQLLC